MEEGAFSDLVIQEIHTLGQNVSKLDRKLDEKLDKVYNQMYDNKKCNTTAHYDINKKLDNHNSIHDGHQLFHVTCKEECVSRGESKVSTNMFKWIIGFIITASAVSMITIGALGLETQEKLARHIYFAEFIYYEVTGQKWNDSSRESLLKAKEQFEANMKQMDEPIAKQIDEQEETE